MSLKATDRYGAVWGWFIAMRAEIEFRWNKPTRLLRRRDVVVEVPKRLVQLRQSELVNENLGEKAIALDLARRAAIGAFPTVAEQILGLYDEAAPTWHEQRYQSWISDLAITKKMATRRGG